MNAEQPASVTWESSSLNPHPWSNPNVFVKAHLRSEYSFVNECIANDVSGNPTAVTFCLLSTCHYFEEIPIGIRGGDRRRGSNTRGRRVLHRDWYIGIRTRCSRLLAARASLHPIQCIPSLQDLASRYWSHGAVAAMSIPYRRIAMVTVLAGISPFRTNACKAARVT